MKRSVLVGLALLVAAGAGIGVWLATPPQVPPASAAADRPASVLDALPADLPILAWAAQARARFEPCGCVAGMNGGLMRRAGLLARLPAGRTLSLELGGWSAGKRAHERLRSGFYLRGLAAAGVDVLAIGSEEIALGAAELAAQLGLGGRPPAVCANLDGAAPAWLPFIELSAGGRRFLVTAVVARGTAGAGLEVRDPVEALTTAAIEAARREATLVCLADLDPDACLALAAAVPQVALVIGGRSDHPSPAPRAVGTARVLWAGNHGKVAGWWAWGTATAAFELLGDHLPEKPAQRDLLGAYQRALAEAKFDNAPAGGMSALAGDGGWTGSEACTVCHPGAAKVHAASLHHRALASLTRRGYQYDPDCLRCHVTGLGEGGYQRGIDLFAEVSCESCHGPASAHVSAATAGRSAGAPMPKLGAAACVTCHDADNSPAFAYPAYWPKIQHSR